MTPVAPIEAMLLKPGMEAVLGRFLADISQSGEEIFFHPHRTDEQSLRALATVPGDDLYFLFLQNGSAVAYGLLRGWNEGFAVPSLGIAVHPASRRMGLGRFIMDFLEATARLRNAPSIRLRVHGENLAALQLYAARGYEFAESADEAGQFVGFKKLGY